MLTRDVYRPDIATCEPDEELHEVARTMEAADSGLVAVVTDGRLAGVISERDLVRALAQEPDPGKRPAIEFATQYVWTAGLDEDVTVVARRMLDHGIRRLPVVGAQGELLGMVSMRDLFTVETLMDHTPEA